MYLCLTTEAIQENMSTEMYSQDESTGDERTRKRSVEIIIIIISKRYVGEHKKGGNSLATKYIRYHYTQQ